MHYANIRKRKIKAEQHSPPARADNSHQPAIAPERTTQRHTGTTAFRPRPFLVAPARLTLPS
jgi:hypothetical protein